MLEVLDNICFPPSQSLTKYVLIHMHCILHSAVLMGTTRSVISAQFKNEDDSDVVAPPSQHSASGSADSIIDSAPTKAHSFLSKLRQLFSEG